MMCWVSSSLNECCGESRAVGAMPTLARRALSGFSPRRGAAASALALDHGRLDVVQQPDQWLLNVHSYQALQRQPTIATLNRLAAACGFRIVPTGAAA